MFSSYTLDNLPENPYLAIDELCKEFRNLVNGQQPDEFPSNVNINCHEDYITDLGILQSLMDSFGIGYEQIEFSASKADNIRKISLFFQRSEDSIAGKVALMKLEEAKSTHRTRWGGIFLYEFSESEVEKIQIETVEY